MEEVSQITNHQQQVTKNNSFLVTLLSILLIISCLVAGFFAWQTQKIVKELTILSVKPTPAQTLVSTSTPNPTTDWKTYTNNYWGVSFKYPDTMFGLCQNYNTEKEGIRFWSANFDCVDGHDGVYKIGLVGYGLGKYKEYKKPYSVGSVIVGEKQAQKKTYVYDEADGPLFGFKKSVEIVFTLKNGTLVFQQVGVIPEEIKAFEQILSTFKFIKTDTSSSPIACTEEAKLCPDGSSVGRIAPNCEFAPCP